MSILHTFLYFLYLRLIVIFHFTALCFNPDFDAFSFVYDESFTPYEADSRKRILKPSRTFVKSTEPIYMVNPVKFRETAQYTEYNPQELKDFSKISGRECMYTRYLSGCLAVPINMPKLFSSGICGDMSNPGEKAECDEIAIMEFRSMRHFRGFMNTEEFLKKARPHRMVAEEK
jgi:hypothetical protein